jgi:hypothetical protein
MAARHRSTASYITGMYGSKRGRRVKSVTVYEPGVWSGKDAQVKYRYSKGSKTTKPGWVAVKKTKDLPAGSVAKHNARRKGR